MKKILLFSLLGFIGCAKVSTGVQHQIVCMDTNEKFTTYNVISAGDVTVFTLWGHPLLSYRDVNTNELAHIDLAKNDCEIE